MHRILGGQLQTRFACLSSPPDTRLRCPRWLEYRGRYALLKIQVRSRHIESAEQGKYRQSLLEQGGMGDEFDGDIRLTASLFEFA